MRCVECGQPIARGEAADTFRRPPALRAGAAHREVTFARHRACQEKVEREVAASAARAEKDRQEMLRAIRGEERKS